EHLAFRESFLPDDADVESDVLPLAARVGEAKIRVFDVVVLDELQDILGGGHRTNSPFSGLHHIGEPGPVFVKSRPDPIPRCGCEWLPLSWRRKSFHRQSGRSVPRALWCRPPFQPCRRRARSRSSPWVENRPRILRRDTVPCVPFGVRTPWPPSP